MKHTLNPEGNTEVARTKGVIGLSRGQFIETCSRSWVHPARQSGPRLRRRIPRTTSLKNTTT
jgi:hypothetical protein